MCRYGAILEKGVSLMVRLLRVSPVGVPQHIVQCGNNRQGSALGSERFAAQIEALTDRRVTPGKAGRPQKIVVLINVTLTQMALT